MMDLEQKVQSMPNHIYSQVISITKMKDEIEWKTKQQFEQVVESLKTDSERILEVESKLSKVNDL